MELLKKVPKIKRILWGEGRANWMKEVSIIPLNIFNPKKVKSFC